MGKAHDKPSWNTMSLDIIPNDDDDPMYIKIQVQWTIQNWLYIFKQHDHIFSRMYAITLTDLVINIVHYLFERNIY